MKKPPPLVKRRFIKKKPLKKLKFCDRRVVRHKPKLHDGLVIDPVKYLTEKSGIPVSERGTGPQNTVTKRGPYSKKMPHNRARGRPRKIPLSYERMFAQVYNMNKKVVEDHCRRVTVCLGFPGWSV